MDTFEAVSETDKEELEDLAEVYKALGNEARLAVLLQLDNGESVSPLTDELGITRSGLQKNIERLIDAGLVYRPTDSDQTYSLTELGEFFVGELRDEKQHVDEVLDDFRSQLEELRKEEQETLERMEEAGVGTKELENKLRAEAWESIEFERPVIEDWLSLLQQFERAKGLEPVRPDHISLEDYVKDEQNESGGNLLYTRSHAILYLWLEYSTSLLSEQDILLRGTISVNEDYGEAGPYLDTKSVSIYGADYPEIREKIRRGVAEELDYLSVPDVDPDSPDIAKIEIPRDYDESKVQNILDNLNEVAAEIAVNIQEKETEQLRENQ